MLRGWPIAMVAATGASGLFAFGVVQSAFAAQAQALFIVFAAFLLLFALANAVFRRRHAHGHGDHAVVMSGRLVGAVTVIAAVLAVVYFWNANQLSGEKIGRHLDRSVVSLSHQAQDAFRRLTDGRPESAAASEDAPPQEG